MDGLARPKRILALDGGGLRGIATIAFLERLEARLAAAAGRPVPLHEHFDLIGGTSTGAIIAAGLALGLSAGEIRRHYLVLAPKVFRRGWRRIPLVHALFSGEALRREIASIVGDRRLDTPDLRTGLAVVAKRLDTGSVWYLTNNPAAPYWNDPPDGSWIGNRHYPLAGILRASTAAPHFFDPQRIEVVAGAEPGLFVDGGVSSDNNPALALLQIATIPAYGYGWQTGAGRLEITSIGTGSCRHRVSPRTVLSRFALSFAVDALRSMINDAEARVLLMMKVLGRCETPWLLDSEIGDLAGVCIVPEPLFTFRRYDLLLERDWLARELGEAVTEAELARLRDMAGIASMQRLYGLASRAADRQM